MRGETRRKARSRYPGDEALRRVSPRRQRERRRRERGITRGRRPSRRRRSLEVCEAETPSTAPNSTRGAMRGLLRRRQRSGTLLGEADCTGLDPEAVYVYGGNRRLSVTRAVHESTRSESEGERVEGRARRPPQRASTVAAKQAARCQANQHCKHNTPAQNSTLYYQSNAKPNMV